MRVLDIPIFEIDVSVFIQIQALVRLQMASSIGLRRSPREDAPEVNHALFFVFWTRALDN